MVREGDALAAGVRRSSSVLHARDTRGGKHAADQGPGLHPSAHGTAGGRHQETRTAVDGHLRRKAARVCVAEPHHAARTAGGNLKICVQRGAEKRQPSV